MSKQPCFRHKAKKLRELPVRLVKFLSASGRTLLLVPSTPGQLVFQGPFTGVFCKHISQEAHTFTLSPPQVSSRLCVSCFCPWDWADCPLLTFILEPDTEGNRNTSSQNMSLWHKNCFELKTIKKQQKQKKLPLFCLKAGYKFSFYQSQTRGLYEQILLH